MVTTIGFKHLSQTARTSVRTHFDDLLGVLNTHLLRANACVVLRARLAAVPGDVVVGVGRMSTRMALCPPALRGIYLASIATRVETP